MTITPSHKSFLDTSVVFKLQVGDTAHKEHLSNAIPQKWYVNNYVEMEFYRAFLMQCIEVYFESADPSYVTFGDVFKVYAEGFGRQAKVVASVLTSMESDGYSLTNPNDKEFLRQRLQDFIFFMAQQFRTNFTDMGADPSKCARVPHPIKLPKDPSERDAVLRKAFLTFDDKKACRKGCSIESLFMSEKYKNKLEVVAATTVDSDALEKIRKAIRKAQGNPSAITCTACSKMGDVVAVASLDSAWKFHSMDSVHEHICESITMTFAIHQSSKAVVKANKPTDS
jgi:hypothetical protein